MGYRRSKLSKDELIKRRTKAVGLRTAGHSYQAIADNLGYSNRANAYRDVKKALTELQHAATDELRELELERLDAATRAIFKQVLKGDTKAIQTLLQIMTRRARYVPGLEVPQEHELSSNDGTIQVVISPNLGDKPGMVEPELEVEPDQD